MSRAVQIFRLAFADEHESRHRESARPSAFAGIWAFLRDCEPRGFLAAREDGRLVGYAIFLSSLRRVQWRALRSGAVFGWVIAALRGGFAMSAAAMGRLLLNKLLFVRGANRYRTQGDAQLLNIAVDPSMQGRGIAAALVRRGLEVMRALGVTEIRLEVRPWNLRAVRLYHETGWREVGRTRDLEGEWLVMVANP